MSEKRKCTFTIETGPISVRSFEAMHSTIARVAHALVPCVRADIQVTSDSEGNEGMPMSSRVNVRATKDTN